jgi:hypothetical protein
MACSSALCPAWQKKLPRPTTGHRLLVTSPELLLLLLLLLGAAAAAAGVALLWLLKAVPLVAAGSCCLADAAAVGSPAQHRQVSWSQAAQSAHN